MITLNIIGTGNVAQHLIGIFVKTEGIQLQQVYSRKKDSVVALMPSDKIITKYEDLQPADVTIIAVTDDAIAEVANSIPYQNHLVVHTSGSMGFDILNPKNRKGVFYPLQTFSKSKEIDFKKVPLCLETDNEEDFRVLETLGRKISESVYKIDAAQRLSLHIAAVFSCNFVNHLYQLGNEICTENKVPFEILLPLIEETADKIKKITPQEAQTGPAIRGDQKTIEKHLSYLKDDNKKRIYQLLTQSIQKRNG